MVILLYVPCVCTSLFLLQKPPKTLPNTSQTPPPKRPNNLLNKNQIKDMGFPGRLKPSGPPKPSQIKQHDVKHHLMQKIHKVRSIVKRYFESLILLTFSSPARYSGCWHRLTIFHTSLPNLSKPFLVLTHIRGTNCCSNPECSNICPPRFLHGCQNVSACEQSFWLVPTYRLFSTYRSLTDMVGLIYKFLYAPSWHRGPLGYLMKFD